jgi:hypothetical protein
MFVSTLKSDDLEIVYILFTGEISWIKEKQTDIPSLSMPTNAKYDLNDRPINVSSDSKLNKTNHARIEQNRVF